MKCNLKSRTFFKGVICRIIRLTGNCNVLWENQQTGEEFIEWNIHYLLNSSHNLSNSATQGKHFLVSIYSRQTPLTQQTFSFRHVSLTSIRLRLVRETPFTVVVSSFVSFVTKRPMINAASSTI